VNKQQTLRRAWELRDGPAVFTTVSQDGIPNAVYVQCMQLLDDGRIAIMDNYFCKTKDNLQGGSKASFLLLTKPGDSYQAKGSIEYFTSGPIYEQLKESVDPKHPRVGAAVLSVEELYSGSKKLE
jgi:predicted pyridoxine 5'-phosphate oxidase superfamily flavin-nucleotide-binding protein